MCALRPWIAIAMVSCCVYGDHVYAQAPESIHNRTPTREEFRDQYVTLRDHFESRIASVIETMSATDRAIAIRLESMNELRDQINTERGQYITRTEFSAVQTQNEKDLRLLRDFRSEMSGKASLTSVIWTALISLLSILLSLIVLIRSFEAKGPPA